MEMTASRTSACAPAELGVTLRDGGADVAVFSHFGERIWFCVFNETDGREINRWRLAARDGDIHYGFVPGVGAGTRYGLRADGPDDRTRGHWFDPAKLLTDPYARRIDRPFAWRPELAAPRRATIDTAPYVPRAIIERPEKTDVVQRPKQPPSLIYEVAVRTFARQHPDVPHTVRGTLAALSHPRVIDHLLNLGVSHIELLPVAAWIDERHLQPLGLSNVWGYNPVTFMALDPRLAPGGIADLRHTVHALHDAGISVLLDVVFNHSGESDAQGATLSLRGLDNAIYYSHTQAHPAELVNDAGCGNTLACERGPVVRLVMDSLRRFVIESGVDGFRFDLAAAIARTQGKFNRDAPLLSAIMQDPVLAGKVLIAEPWDVGPDGYHLGAFHAPWMEWNDRYRDGVRRFWRGDADAAGECATRIAGSPDVFAKGGRGPISGVNFLAAHDGFTLRDCVTYSAKHNQANGENNRDGHNDNLSWNCGVEGENSDEAVKAARQRDVRAMLAMLFLSRGTPMLTSGDELGRTQQGNNNVYAQDNALTWLDWLNADVALVKFTAALSRFRRDCLAPTFDRYLTGSAANPSGVVDVTWLRTDARPMAATDWTGADQFSMTLALDEHAHATRVHIVVNRSQDEVCLTLPELASDKCWRLVIESSSAYTGALPFDSSIPEAIPGRCVSVFAEC